MKLEQDMGYDLGGYRSLIATISDITQEDIEDIVQDVQLILHEHKQVLKPDLAWNRTIVRNKLLDKYRARLKLRALHDVSRYELADRPRHPELTERQVDILSRIRAARGGKQRLLLKKELLRDRWSLI